MLLEILKGDLQGHWITPGHFPGVFDKKALASAKRELNKQVLTKAVEKSCKVLCEGEVSAVHKPRSKRRAQPVPPPAPSSRGAHTPQVVLELLSACFCAVPVLLGFGGSWFWERRNEGEELAALETLFDSKLVPRCREVTGDGHCRRKAKHG